MSELEFCPFCGGKNIVVIEISGENYTGEQFEAVCDATNGGCGASGGAAPSRAEAIEKWNRREERTCSPVEPFDRKTKHIVERGSSHYYWPYKGCSECQCDFPQGSNYCPNCGARVKEEADAD